MNREQFRNLLENINDLFTQQISSFKLNIELFKK
jgi:hypothetical protein